MARKPEHMLKSRQKKAAKESWAAVGADTSMSAISLTAIGYDAMRDKMTHVAYKYCRWSPDDHYFDRLKDAVRSHELLLDLLHEFWILDPAQVYIAVEEPWYYGASKHGDSMWLKQTAEVAGAFKGGLVKFGFTNIHEINNSQWKKVLRQEGVPFIQVPKGTSRAEKDKIALKNKFLVKQWAIQAYKLPDLPDLVKSKSGAKIPRPESGFGAKAKAIQPDDIYDAAACMAWMADAVERGHV